MCFSIFAHSRRALRSRKPKPTVAHADPAIPSPDGKCHFFRLPGELRNMIYAYALSSDHPVRYILDTDNVGHLCSFPIPANNWIGNYWLPDSEHNAVREWIIWNMLKFANRQLYNETHNLTLRYNELFFGCITDLSDFLDVCPAHFHSRFGIIWIKLGIARSPASAVIDADPAEVENVFRFCRDNPHVSVRDLDMSLIVDQGSFVLRVVDIQMLARKSTEFLQKFISSARYQQTLIDFFLRDNHVKSLDAFAWDFPSNYRFWASPRREPGETIMETFIRLTSNMDYIPRRAFPDTPGKLERWTTMAKDIFENGI
ncbi:hypothetical protein P153DRAFT_361339 [Dothidotthia symphoricarpi CBS 119687]|uniref:Uncharacterized protein n=1 Tax=Dothidotthia symphoricarpi CBS 119687 TaxID=1392245 RepID=A0A6A5ZZ42_9PLEO|nr:uncharacterized protein P153DRAFT_361339 [Dothidotthia symphoricarpi CBS 119687]KAF2124153.1 hypothetical protein P153DRAFT_361339 [Dothidotthia symphoricarpi CBS 119687]